MSFGMDTAIQNGWVEGEKFPRLKDWHDRLVARGAYERALTKGNGYDLVNYGM
jgi:glutathione S-transferase